MCPISHSPNSRRWWRAFTTPASKSFSTLSTITQPKEISSVRRLSFKGIDNASYYRLLPDEPRYYINDTGTGNTLNLSHPRVLQMVTDSLRYWVQEMHVDGFRFDLGTILAREPHGFDQGGGFLDSCGQDPVLSSVKLIAEPWDVGPGGYQVGAFPPGWAEWNDRYRDTVRSYWKGDEGKIADFAARLSGSGDFFIAAAASRGRASISSPPMTASRSTIWFPTTTSITKRTAKTTATVTITITRGIMASKVLRTIRKSSQLRERQKRNLLSTLLFSQGTPMILAGDEFGRTQQGNNNAYCQDNDISWVDWRSTSEPRPHRLCETSDSTAPTVSGPAAEPVFDATWNEELGVKDSTWLTPTGEEMTADDWHNPAAKCFGLLLDGRAQTSGIRQRGSESTLFLITNAHHDVVLFTLPNVAGGRDWRRLVDTNQPEEDDDSDRPVLFKFSQQYQVTGRSLLLLVLRQARSQRRRAGEQSAPPNPSSS